MSKKKHAFKFAFLIFALAAYTTLIITQLSQAEPTGADISNNVTVTYTTSPDSRTDLGATITTIDLSVSQQDAAWKAYVGNITGTLVLKNSGGFSIYEWSMGSSTLSGNIFVSRDGTVSWDDIECADDSAINAEQAAVGMSSDDSDSINSTFNSTVHASFSISGVGTIANGTCQSTATYVNSTYQGMDQDTTYFQEILLFDTTTLVYGTKINQDAYGYDSNSSLNITHDFQLIVAENRTATTGTTYYFYADIA